MYVCRWRRLKLQSQTTRPSQVPVADLGLAPVRPSACVGLPAKCHLHVRACACTNPMATSSEIPPGETPKAERCIRLRLSPMLSASPPPLRLTVTLAPVPRGGRRASSPRMGHLRRQGSVPYSLASCNFCTKYQWKRTQIAARHRRRKRPGTTIVVPLVSQQTQIWPAAFRSLVPAPGIPPTASTPRGCSGPGPFSSAALSS